MTIPEKTKQPLKIMREREFKNKNNVHGKSLIIHTAIFHKNNCKF